MGHGAWGRAFELRRIYHKNSDVSDNDDIFEHPQWGSD